MIKGYFSTFGRCGANGQDLEDLEDEEERLGEEGRTPICSRKMPSSLVIVARRSDELIGVLMHVAR